MNPNDRPDWSDDLDDSIFDDDDWPPRGLRGWHEAQQATKIGLHLGACKRLGVGPTLALSQLRAPAASLAATILLVVMLPLPSLLEVVGVLATATALRYAWYIHAVDWRNDGSYYTVEPLPGQPNPDRP